MIWTSIRGHGAQVEMMRRAVGRGRLAHAYVFVGPEGIGKRLVARNMAQCLFCRRVADEDLEACGECSACRQVRAGTHPDLLEIGCPEGKRELPIALIAGANEQRGREGLCHDLSLRPMSASRRIAIIDDADAMNDESANALLKTLEEPPAGSILFLISPTTDALLPTIRSRCQPLQFAPLATADIADLLAEFAPEASREDRATAAELGEGSLAVARRLLDPGLRKLRETVQAQLSARELNSLETADQFVALVEELGSDAGSQRQIAGWLLQFAAAFYRDLLSELVGGNEATNPAATALLVRSGSAVEAADRVGACLDRCVQADLQIQQMMPVPLALEGLCVDLARVQRLGLSGGV